jgi:hypothetical protein
MTNCQKLKDTEAEKLTRDGNALEKGSCPPCDPSICYGKMNQCPLHTGKFSFNDTLDSTVCPFAARPSLNIFFLKHIESF